MEEPERADPSKRSDWLSNLWSYVHSVEKRLMSVENRLAKLEKLHKKHTLDED